MCTIKKQRKNNITNVLGIKIIKKVITVEKLILMCSIRYKHIQKILQQSKKTPSLKIEP